jgi:cell division protein FtsB
MSPYRKQRIAMYWITVLLLAALLAFFSYTIIDSAAARHDADRQLSTSRASATRRIDILTAQIRDLQARNVQLERDNAVLSERSK